ncbi:recombination regulator RecX [Crenobacter intestini]|nr:recombination regulator RecX [Crenobacter intestini]
MAEKSLMARAVELLSRREYSRRELFARLKPHAADPDEIEAVLAELAERHWQSDERYAQALAQSKQGRWGSTRLAQALRSKGVDRDTIAEALDGIDDLAACRGLWQKKFGTAPADAQEKARQMRFLAARGFPADVVRKVLAEAGHSHDD